MEFKIDAVKAMSAKVLVEFAELQKLITTAAHIVYGCDNTGKYMQSAGLEVQFPVAEVIVIGQTKKLLERPVEVRNQSNLVVNAYHTWLTDCSGHRPGDHHQDQMMAVTAVAVLQHLDLFGPPDTVCIRQIGEIDVGFVEGLIADQVVKNIINLLCFENNDPVSNLGVLGDRRQGLQSIVNKVVSDH